MELLKRSIFLAAAILAGTALSACETPGEPDAEPAGRTEEPTTGRAAEPGADVEKSDTVDRPGGAAGETGGGSRGY